jgi:hypothetical protein
MMRKTQANVLLAAVMVVGGIFVAVITTAIGTSVMLIPSAYADANCDKAGSDANNQGHRRGNAKQCLASGLNVEGEQPRSCSSPNNSKDNDGDGLSFCIGRGRD